MGRFSDAVAPFLKAIEIEPQNAIYKDEFSSLLLSGDQQAEAVSNCLAAARADPAGFGRFLNAVQFETNYVPLVNFLALAFASSPDSNLRNARYAISLATRACEMTGFKTNYCVGTLAVADAADSRFDEAITNAQLACSLTTTPGQEAQLQQYQALLELFRSHQPLRSSFK